MHIFKNWILSFILSSQQSFDDVSLLMWTSISLSNKRLLHLTLILNLLSSFQHFLFFFFRKRQFLFIYFFLYKKVASIKFLLSTLISSIDTKAMKTRIIEDEFFTEIYVFKFKEWLTRVYFINMGQRMSWIIKSCVYLVQMPQLERIRNRDFCLICVLSGSERL